VLSPFVILHLLSPVTIFLDPHIGDGGLTRCCGNCVASLGDMHTEPLGGVITCRGTMMLHDSPACVDGVQFRRILRYLQDTMALRFCEAVQGVWGFWASWAAACSQLCLNHAGRIFGRRVLLKPLL
jgi:hypothetical protein